MRLGDEIDDHCSRCKRTTDHFVLAMMNGEVAKVRCRTCNNEHNYHYNKNAKKEMTAKEAYDKLVSSMPGGQAQPPEPKEPKKKK